MLCTETMSDLWYEGYGAGLSGVIWTQTTLGRFLSQWQRLALWGGYKTALQDKASWVIDMDTPVYDDAALSL